MTTIRFVIQGSNEHLSLLFKGWREIRWIRVPGSPLVIGLEP